MNKNLTLSVILAIGMLIGLGMSTVISLSANAIHEYLRCGADGENDLNDEIEEDKND